MSELNALWKVWTEVPALKIPQTEYTLKGFSIAALRTNFYISELGIMLDAGLSSNYSPDHILITHSHADHSGNIPWHLFSYKENSKMQIYAPSGSAEKINKFIESGYIMTNDINNIQGTLNVHNYYDMIPVDPGKISLEIKKKKYDIEIIKCSHSVPCVGYGLIEKRQKLKDEYLGLSGKEISNLRKNNVDIYKTIDFPFFCYLGDTSKEVLIEPALEKYSTVMIECTFLYESEVTQADKTMHMHWIYLHEYIKNHPNINFILYHFSQRYKKSEIFEFFELIKKNGILNITPWMN